MLKIVFINPTRFMLIAAHLLLNTDPYKHRNSTRLIRVLVSSLDYITLG